MPKSKPLHVVDCGDGPVWFTGLGDVHWGNPETWEDEVRKSIDQIGERRAWWIGGGDYLECGLTVFTPPGAVWEQTMQPTEQYFAFKDLVKPIAPICIGLLDGNHEERLRKAGFDVVAALCRELDIHNFGPMAQFALKVGSQTYSGAAWHGAGGAVTLGAKVNQLVRGAEVTMPDMRWQFHTHEKVIVASFYEVQKGNRVVFHKTLDIIGGHYCPDPRYMRWRPARKGAVGAVWVELRGDEFSCHATV